MKATRCWIPILVAMVFLGLGTAYAANGFIKTLPEFEEGEVETQGKIDNADAAGIQDGTQINYEEDVANTPPPPQTGQSASANLFRSPSSVTSPPTSNWRHPPLAMTSI